MWPGSSQVPTQYRGKTRALGLRLGLFAFVPFLLSARWPPPRAWPYCAGNAHANPQTAPLAIRVRNSKHWVHSGRRNGGES